MPKQCNQSHPNASDPDYICNPQTGRWVTKTGTVGKSIYKKKFAVAKIKMPTPIGTVTPIKQPPKSSPTAPTATYTMEERLANACKGKTYSNGGLNLGDLLTIAMSKGYSKKKGIKAELIKFLCTGASPSAKPKASASASPKSSNAAVPNVKKHNIQHGCNMVTVKTIFDKCRNSYETDLAVIQHSEAQLSRLDPILRDSLNYWTVNDGYKHYFKKGAAGGTLTYINYKDIYAGSLDIADTLDMIEDGNADYDKKLISGIIMNFLAEYSLAKCTVGHDCYVYRGIKRVEDMPKPGSDTYELTYPTSTSLSIYTGFQFSGGDDYDHKCCFFIFKLKPTTHGAYVGSLDTIKSRRENEVILPAGLKFKLIDRWTTYDISESTFLDMRRAMKTIKEDLVSKFPLNQDIDIWKSRVSEQNYVDIKEHWERIKDIINPSIPMNWEKSGTPICIQKWSNTNEKIEKVRLPTDCNWE
jgi:hypothetical protein